MTCEQNETLGGYACRHFKGDVFARTETSRYCRCFEQDINNLKDCFHRPIFSDEMQSSSSNASVEGEES